MKARPIAIAAAIAIPLAYVFLAGDPSPAREGYFKGDANNRVMAFQAVPGMTPDEAHAYLARVMHTEGRLTMAVIFDGTSAPGDTLTLAPDYFTAATILDTPPYDEWRWGVVIGPDGATETLR
ncbi:MAG: hypothetical protein AAF376_05100 [Pseudomonadota bacterium]